jgi:hypothetical protein
VPGVPVAVPVRDEPSTFALGGIATLLNFGYGSWRRRRAA